MKKIFTLILAALVVTCASAITRLPDQGVYNIKNVYSNTYVVLQNSTLADITAETADDASDLLVWYGARDANGEAILSILSGDDGDMIATLDLIKGLIKETLEYYNKPTWFLDEMFQLHLVPTGDADGSVYLCVDVPEIENWEEIRDIILDAAGGQTAINYYITHMHPGNRHYMGIDYDGSFGYRLEAGTPEGTDIKFLMEPCLDFESGFCFIKNADAENNAPYLRRVHSLRSTVDLEWPRNDASAVFELGTDGHMVNKLAVQGLDLAPLTAALGDGAYMTLCPTNSVDDKFTYNNAVLKLQLPDEGVVANAVLAAAAQALGEDSKLYAALSSKSDLIADRAALYFVLGENGDVDIVGDDGLLELADAGKWQIEYIDGSDFYFAPEATVEANGKYYTTLKAAFNYTIVNPDKVTAYLVRNVAVDGTPELEAIEDNEIPAGEAVLLECATQDDEDNMLMPFAVANPSGAPRAMPETPLLTMLEGTYFDDDTPNDKNFMLTLQDGMTFAVDNALEYMPANKAWANKQIVTAITTVKTDAQSDDAVYDLLGRKVVNPTHGIYIVNGKKVVK